MDHCLIDNLVSEQLLTRPKNLTYLPKDEYRKRKGDPPKILIFALQKKPPIGSTPAWRLCSFRYDLGASPAYPLQIAIKKDINKYGQRTVFVKLFNVATGQGQAFQRIRIAPIISIIWSSVRGPDCTTERGFSSHDQVRNQPTSVRCKGLMALCRQQLMGQPIRYPHQQRRHHQPNRQPAQIDLPEQSGAQQRIDRQSFP